MASGTGQWWQHPAATWVGGAIACYGVVIAVGACQYEGKWHRIPGHGWDFVSGKHFSSCYNEQPIDEGPSAPCYFGLRNEVQHIFCWVCLLPFAPWLVALVAGFLVEGQHGCYRADLHLGSIFILSLGSATVGHSMRRLADYLLFFFGFYAFYGAKIVGRAELECSFDSSDHVTVSMVGLAIAFAEVSVAYQSPRIVFAITALAAGVVWVCKAYFSFYTCSYFHTPAEVSAGSAAGLVLTGLFL
ncbi:unnamed protein product, partial [Polarella glacialis]